MNTALDRPVWSMLNGPQAELALGNACARRIDPAFGPFAAAADRSDAALAALAEICTPGEEVWLVEAEELLVPGGFTLLRSAPLVQMVARDPQPVLPNDEPSVLLGADDAAAMRAIALATKPGPWGSKTQQYGQFHGIRREGKLAAMAGERMRPAPGLAEVSGVCTWPEFRGQGLAGVLIRQVMAGFTERGDVPFLHSYAGNTKAIALYQSLGFAVRREMVAMVLMRD